MDDHLSGTAVADDLTRANPSDGRADLIAPIRPCSGWGLPSRQVSHDAGALLPHRFSFSPRASRGGVFFSVALSVASPRPAVSRHPALWSPDFPHARRSARAIIRPTPAILRDCTQTAQAAREIGSPYGVRTRASALRGRRPRPLDERAVAGALGLEPRLSGTRIQRVASYTMPQHRCAGPRERECIMLPTCPERVKPSAHTC